MFNSQKPSIDDLPNAKQLAKSTVIALLTALVILFTVVLPAEYGIDPTGIGEALGLKKMGEIKISLEEEAQADEVAEAKPALTADPDANTSLVSVDKVTKTLAPGESIEIKLEMKSDAVVSYEWLTSGGSLNFNSHGDGYKGTGQSVTYGKGRMVNSDSGELIAAFDGYHGWFWRNREEVPVTFTLKVKGDYIQIKEMG